jgi:hypothetical protein
MTSGVWKFPPLVLRRCDFVRPAKKLIAIPNRQHLLPNVKRALINRIVSTGAAFARWPPTERKTVASKSALSAKSTSLLLSRQR